MAAMPPVPPPRPDPPPEPQILGLFPRKNLPWVILMVIVGGGLFVAFLVLGGESGSGESDSDLLARHACEDYASLVGQADVMNASELHDELSGIWDNAQYTDDAAVRDAAHDLLAAEVSVDTATFESAVSRMDSACHPYLD